MRVEKIKFEDFNGVEHEKEYYFNLSKPELGRLEYKYKNGLEAEMKRMVDEDDRAGMMEFLESIIIGSFGEKTPDGMGFIKDEEATKSFKYSAAYSELYGKLFSDENYLEEFIRGIIPKVDNPVPAPALETKPELNVVK